MWNVRFAVTSSKDGSPALPAMAREWAEELGAPFVPRKSLGTLEEMMEELAVDALLIATANGPQVFTREGNYFYHPGMGAMRWERVRQGENDHFLASMDLRPGMRVLDATLGLGGDALIASLAVGDSGKVVGLEASPLLFFVNRMGMRDYKAKYPAMEKDLQRIEVVHGEALEYLRSLPDDSFDRVYFDPMFRRPVKGSCGMTPLRPLSWNVPLTRETVEEALRVAPRVVIKERSRKLLASFGCREIGGGRYARVQFGIRTRGDGADPEDGNNGAELPDFPEKRERGTRRTTE